MDAITTSHRNSRGSPRSALLVAAGVAALALPFIAVGPAEAAPDDVNLRRGGVYSLSNDPAGNTVVAFSRSPDGTLVPAGEYDTGGTGSGGFEDSANSLVLGNASTESSPNNLSGANDLLFATNAGSDDVSVFRVGRTALERVELQDSGGEKPVSITVSDGVAYVLNSNEERDGLVPPNCSDVADPGASVPTITGFDVSPQGQLTPIPGATYTLSGDANSGCAQVSFSPDGETLVVTERTARTAGQAADDEGVIVTFQVADDGTLTDKVVNDAVGQGPFGFTFRRDGTLLTSEQFDGPAGPSLGAAASYAIDEDGTLASTGPSVRNGGTDTCWIVANDAGDLAFATSFFSNNDPDAGFPADDQDGSRISSYRIAPDGSLELLDPIAFDAEQGASDISFSRNSRYLYQLNSFNGTINAFEVGNDGSLELIQTVQAHDASAMAARLGLAAS